MLEQGTSSAQDSKQWARQLWRGWRVQRGGRDREGGVRVRSGDENGGEWETLPASGDRKGSGTEDFTSLPFDTAFNVLGMFG